ncbi:MAG: class I SAM-dependent methyltransferase [Saprospiraceae bacterium]|jgi:SAM-dependent methyltransferase|nr:class I SAM-dependent methyltransferase [Saprospiraceae bacterium]MBK9993072.1 class I SAM-dependent methyltransferase [Saprospiraceae bacterium]
MSKIQTAERVSATDFSDNYVYQRSVFAYHEAAKIVRGKVCEIGTGSGYGVRIIAPVCDEFVTIDKFRCELDFSEYKNVKFIQMEIPPFAGIAENTFDYVITFQVIEHIENDKSFLQEINRVLKPGGKLILTTPNKIQSLTRNPWHVREYTVDELVSLFEQCGFKVNASGVFGSKNVDSYLEKNKQSIQRITRWDIFNLQYKLPRTWLQIPYDLMNRMNRKKVANSNREITQNIRLNDFSIQKATGECLDLFYIGEK